jgi:hypothetical protein
VTGDPSAGSGGILDYLAKSRGVDPDNLYACEIDPELRMVLTGKKYKPPTNCRGC